MPVNVVLLGPPGAGKGTQAERLAAAFEVPKVSTGEILREAVHDATDLGAQVKAVMAAGKLVGDDLMIEIVRERLARPDAARGFVLDGFPRTVAQAKSLDRILEGRGPLTVLNIAVPVDEIVRRLTTRRICDECGATAEPGAGGSARCSRCGGTLVPRQDDGEEVVRERLQVFEREMRPLVAHYERTPAFFSVDGNLTPGEVAATIRSIVESPASVGAGERSGRA